MASETVIQKLPTMSSSRRPRYTAKSSAGMPEFDMFPPLGKTNGFVIQITEAPPPLNGPPSIVPETHDTAEHIQRQKPQPPPLAIPPKAYISRPPSPPTSPPARNRVPSPTKVPLARSSANSPSNSGATPVMRSMFPRYDPNVPFTQQKYRPDIDRVPGLASAMAVAGTSSYRPPSYQLQANNRPSSAYLQSEEEKLKAANIKESPLRSADNAEQKIKLSSPEQLLGLWDIANGQTSSEDIVDAYVLELSCDDLALGREIITFNASTSDPIYTLEASSHSKISVSRTHPGNRNPTIQITTSTLEKPTPTDPLVTCTFPKLAGIMAVDHSSTVAVAHKLDRKASADLQSEAISRAQEHEASMLLWDSDSNRYCLMHPTLLDSAATTLPIRITPNPSNPQTIAILAPETDDTPLLTLSLDSLALTLHAPAIKALPSLYILDTLMSTLLALLLHLHRSCATTPPTPSIPPVSKTPPHRSQPLPPLFPPPPTHASSPSSSSSSLGKNKYKKKTKNNNKRSLLPPSVFRPTTNSTKSFNTKRPSHHPPPSIYGDDVELQYLPPPQSPHSPSPFSSWSSRPGSDIIQSRATRTKQTSSSCPSSTANNEHDYEDEPLPRATRAVLRLLYWSFELLFWCLAVAVRLLAKGVVGVGRVVGRL